MKKRWLWRGFTLVELLVVIAIIGILVALLLPAIQAAREAGRRISCGNNVKQLVLGIHDYHDVHSTFPLNYANLAMGPNPWTGTDSESKSWMVGVLPFIEQKPLWDTIVWSDNPAASPPRFADVGPDRTVAPFPNPQYPNAVVADTIIKSFLCPSDGDNGRGRMAERANTMNGSCTRAVNNYKANAGSGWWHSGLINPTQDTAEDWGPAPFPGWGDSLDWGNGIICRNVNDFAQCYHGLEFVTDGTSNTFAVGEAVPAWCTHSWWYWFNGSTATCGIPLNYKRPETLAGTTSLEQFKWQWPENYSFMSRHPTGAQFGLCDGSVRFINDSIDLRTYKRLSTAAGGRPATVPN
jgi:prepilin-type N-terminal cleavage/methylation domain-containing protein